MGKRPDIWTLDMKKRLEHSANQHLRDINCVGRKLDDNTKRKTTWEKIAQAVNAGLDENNKVDPKQCLKKWNAIRGNNNLFKKRDETQAEAASIQPSDLVPKQHLVKTKSARKIYFADEMAEKENIFDEITGNFNGFDNDSNQGTSMKNEQRSEPKEHENLEKLEKFEMEMKLLELQIKNENKKTELLDQAAYVIGMIQRRYENTADASGRYSEELNMGSSGFDFAGVASSSFLL